MDQHSTAMICLRRNQCSSSIATTIRSKNYGLFTYCLAFVILFSSTMAVGARSMIVVSRKSDGDDFTNLQMRKCAKFGAHCVDDILVCSQCKCNPGNETYRFDIEKCVSSEDLENYSGCLYQGLKDPPTVADQKLPTLDLTKDSDKNIHAPLNLPRTVDIKCNIANTSSFLNRGGTWIPLSNIAGALLLEVKHDRTIGTPVDRYLNLNWEGVKNTSGLLIKLDIVCNSVTGVDSEKSCFLFKTTGRHIDFVRTKPSLITTKLPSIQTNQYLLPTSPVQTAITSTLRSIVKNYTYSIPRSVIIGISAGVGVVILIIIAVAVFCVRSRMRRTQPPKQVVNIEPPKVVHFTAQARFSLIRESPQAEPLEPSPGDYACLQDKRERYDPYCSLRKDDADLSVIDQVLREAVSMESMEHSSSPRYSYRLSGNQMVIESTSSRSSRNPKYHVLEDPNETNEPDYEEVESSDEDDQKVAARLLETKPPLPVREYHVLEQADATVHSQC